MNDLALLSLPVAFALLCAGVMGFAVQRGATCMVAAVEEFVSNGRMHRLAAMLEAGLWVAIGLLAANAAGVLRIIPADVPVSAKTFAGGAVLGIGALVNRACVFGTIGRIGSGQWTYVFTPVGFFTGCLIANPLFTRPAAIGLPSVLFNAGLVLTVPLALYGAWRGPVVLRSFRDGNLHRKIWSPHLATMIIGLTFVVMMLTVGNWAYTQVLSDAAMRMFTGLPARLLLFIGLLAGAIAGGWPANLIRPTAPRAMGIVRCLAGGAMMGAGSMAVPGGNDSLILIGLPLLLPYAFAALASMLVAIIAGMMAQQRLVELRQAA